jgi:hypothetical protein
MAVWHVINFAIPVACMIGFGFLLDHISKPEVPKKEKE